MSQSPPNQGQGGGGDVPSHLHGESVVISGMSGTFPRSRNVKEFSDILYNKVNPISNDCRWNEWEHPEVPKYSGKVPEIERFDSQYFMVYYSLAYSLDPMVKKILEHSYQAIYDAGVNPKYLNGKKVGVYVAVASSDAEMNIFRKAGKTMSLLGGSKTMYSNRISYWLNTKGPSYTILNACCGFNAALEQAFNDIKIGKCESAIVGAAHLCLLPHSQSQFFRCTKMSSDNKTKSFDANADGCLKSEAISVIFVQKAKDALRIYAEVVHIKNEFISRLSEETGQTFGFTRDPDNTAAFLKQFYSEANIPPQAVEYVEAFGLADPEADKAELEAIEKVFFDKRAEPLFVGSVISNVGYTEAASGGTAITKVLLGYHNSLVASNLHCDTPRQDVAAIRDGRMCVLREHLPFRGSLAALNCLSLTGVNSHVLLRGCTNTKDLNRYKASIPRLVTISARQDESLGSIFEDLKSRPIDPEELALLDNIHSTNVSGHLGRGYIILDTAQEEQNTISLSEDIQHFDDSQRPLWFVYSGMGSQWVGMGAPLMRIPIFAAAIERCRVALEPKGINIVDIITSSDQTTFDNILHSFVGIAAIQIGLTDILTAIGLRPDKIIGHSVGELGCAYADGCLTAEEMILSAYSRGRASLDTPLIKGAMAAVGIGYTLLSRRCPPEIAIACHNSSESSTISGPADKVRDFVASLTAEGIFAREVPCSNIAYHSQYISDAGPNLLRLLSDIIVAPRARSARWLSTSVPPERWDEPIAQYCSAEYLTNNLLSSVYFEETCSLIKSNDVLVEIAPHGLLQAILRRSLPQSCTNIPLALRHHPDNVRFLLDALGKLYVKGFTLHVQALYPRVEFPVSTGTPHLSHLVKWYHAENWPISYQSDDYIKTSSSAKFSITAHDDEHSYLNGNIIQGRVLYPFAASLVAVWDVLAMSRGSTKKAFSVEFSDLMLYSQPILHGQKSMKLNISVNYGNGWFEVTEEDSRIASGFITSDLISQSAKTKDIVTKTLVYNSEELYEHLSSRGYSYRDEFRSISSVDESLSVAQLMWNNNWVTMIDGLLQLNVLRHAHDGVTQPTHIRNITIDVEKHNEQLTKDATYFDAEVDDVFDCTRCGGITINNIQYRNVSNIITNKFKLIPSLSTNRTKNGNVKQEDECSKERNVCLHITTVGDLNTLLWIKAPKVNESGIKVRVEYAGINMSDINRATNVIPFTDNANSFGMDFSGLTDIGDRVMGICVTGSARRMVRARSSLVWPVPAHWSLEDAATVPLAYLQAYYCLFIRSQLRPGSTVLIHSGAGALGQAAISIALARGCQVFTTVSDTSKKSHLLKLFPQLNETSIGHSRDTSFGDLILNATKSKGCDIVLSSGRGPLKNMSLNCVSQFGLMLDTAQLQYREKYKYGMNNMNGARSYVLVDFDSVLKSDDSALLRRLQLLLSEGISRGEVRPLSRVCYWGREATRAFRLLAASRHRGRVLLRLGDSVHPTHNSFNCTPEGSHIIIWDGSSLGLQFANKLVSCGVRKLRLQCSKPTADHLIKLGLWQKLGVDVQIHGGDLCNSDDISKLLKESSECGAVEAIYVIAADTDRSGSEAARVIDLLDTVSRKLCPLLRYFAVISIDCNVGENTCYSRSMNGYPVTALSIPASTDDPDYLLSDNSWIRGAVDAIERALASGVPVQVARPLPPQKPSLDTLITAFADNVSCDYLLKDLKLEESLPFIKSFLNDVYQISFNDEDVLKLTKKRILEIERNSVEHNVDISKRLGLSAFISHVISDEIEATADYIPLDTLVHKVQSMEDDIDMSKTYLFIIPGLEGHYARFRTLCEHLKLPAFVLQPGLDRPQETVTELAHRYAKILLDKFKLKDRFYLAAYECGIFVALELAHILENNGLQGTIYCIGDGPEEMKATLEEELSEFKTDEELQSGVIKHMYSLMCGGAEVPEEVVGASDWDACARALLGRVPQTAQYARLLLQVAHARILTARRYKATAHALRSKLVLLRTGPSRNLTHCSLQHYSRGPLIIRDLNLPLAHAATDLRVPAIINSYLDNDVLEIYLNSNLCSYRSCI